METQKIWDNFNDELYFFILKKVKDKDIANDVFQDTFLKIHTNLFSLKSEDKARGWVFQIARNEIFDYFNKASVHVEKSGIYEEISSQKYENICCFDKFINDLPETYRQVIELIYLKGQKQKDVAQELGISLENVKARIKRAKDILKKKFNECCKYEFDKNGKLVGESNCSVCKAE